MLKSPSKVRNTSKGWVYIECFQSGDSCDNFLSNRGTQNGFIADSAFSQDSFLESSAVFQSEGNAQKFVLEGLCCAVYVCVLLSVGCTASILLDNAVLSATCLALPDRLLVSLF